MPKTIKLHHSIFKYSRNRKRLYQNFSRRRLKFMIEARSKRSENKMINHYYNGKRLPEYYDTMYLDGYTGDEVYVAFHRSLQKQVSEMQ